LECSKTGETYDADRLQNLSQHGAPLLARYDLGKVTVTPADLAAGPRDLWRYAQVLPVRDIESVVKLGEGWTPLLSVERLRAHLRLPHLFLKNEAVNPTGSFKDRGMAVAVARARELGARALAVGTRLPNSQGVALGSG